jgi:hypothetical protein
MPIIADENEYFYAEVGNIFTQYYVKKIGGKNIPVIKAVNRENKRSRRYRDRDFAKFERSRRYRDR